MKEKESLIERLKEYERQIFDLHMKTSYEIAKEKAKEEIKKYEASVLKAYKKEWDYLTTRYTHGLIEEQEYNKLVSELRDKYGVQEVREGKL